MKTESTQPIPNTEYLTPAGPWRINFNSQSIIRKEPESGKEIKIYTADFVECSELTREKAVEALIRRQYTLNDELGIHRNKLAGVDTGQFNEYNIFVEACKSIATASGILS